MTAPKRTPPPPPAYYRQAGLEPPPQYDHVPIRVYRTSRRRRPARRGFSCLRLGGCFTLIFAILILGGLTALYMLLPNRTNLLLMGVDYVDPSVTATVARSDTIILTTFVPSKRYIGMLSIPRDLWVPIPGYGENRINTAHFFGEAQSTGGGPAALIQTIETDFGVPVDYYLRIRFEGFRDVVEALGGVDLVLDKPMAGYPAGTIHLKARKALGFVRSRAGSDDFFRMQQGQVMIKSIYQTALKPKNWARIPAVIRAGLKSVSTDVPVWMWPRLALTFLWVGSDGIDSRIITREMVTPFTTDQGAQVLLPNWGLINPVVKEIFLK